MISKMALNSQKQKEIDKASFYFGLGAGSYKLAVITLHKTGEISDEEYQKEIQMMEELIEEPSNEALLAYLEYLNSLEAFEGQGIFDDTLDQVAAATEIEMRSIDQESCEKGYLVQLSIGLYFFDYKFGRISAQEFQIANEVYQDIIKNPSLKKVDEYLSCVDQYKASRV